MRKELEMKLAEKYPFMGRTETSEEQEAKYGRIENLFQAFGYECDDGWFSILDSMCDEILTAYEETGQPVNLVVGQVKEKYGTLRFYYHFEGQTSGAAAIDFLGQGALRVPGEPNPLHERVAAIVSKWEDKSATVCEKCGKPGKLRTDRRWIRTLCDECAQVGR